MEYLKLRDGNQIPGMGYGCYNAFGDEMVRSGLDPRTFNGKF